MRKLLPICAILGALFAVTFLGNKMSITRAAPAGGFSGLGGTYGTGSILLSNSVTTLIGSTAYTWILPGTTAATNTTTGAVAPAIALKQGQSVSFWLQSGSSNTTSSAHSVVFITSPDAIHWDTASPFVLTQVPGTATTQTYTNWSILGYIAPWYITNASADSGGAHGWATNIAIRYALPGY